MSARLPESFVEAVRELSRLPGLGTRAAERMVFHLLNQPGDHLRRLGQAILQLQEKVRYCTICHHLAHGELCDICSDERRGEETLLVVEMPQDLLRFEECLDYRGRYHVLGGRYAPLDGIFPEDLNIDTLIRRIKKGGVREIVLGLGMSTEGEATCELLRSKLAPHGLQLSRLATGLQQGSELQWAGRGALQDSFQHRRALV